MGVYVQNLEKALDEIDIQLIRSIIIGFVDADKSNHTFQFQQKAEYADKELKKKGAGLFEEEDGYFKIPEEKHQWDEDLWHRLKIELQDNFSREKVNRLEEMMGYLRVKGEPLFQPINNKPDEPRTPVSRTDSDNSKKDLKKNPFFPVLIGASGGLIIGLGIVGGGTIISKKIIVSGVGIICGGALGLVISRQKRNEGHIKK